MRDRWWEPDGVLLVGVVVVICILILRLVGMLVLAGTSLYLLWRVLSWGF